MQAYDTVFGDEPAQREARFDDADRKFRIILSDGTSATGHMEGEIADGTVSVAWWLRGEDAAWQPWAQHLHQDRRLTPCAVRRRLGGVELEAVRSHEETGRPGAR